nr:hypothetical protein [Ostreibacterium oceani]
MTLEQYINNLNQRYQLGNATEHTFRGDLQLLLETLVPTIRATNETNGQQTIEQTTTPPKNGSKTAKTAR